MPKTNASHYIRNGLQWTAGEDRILKEAYNKLKTFKLSDYKKLSTYLHRSVDAIQSRLVKMHIYPKQIAKNLHKDNYQNVLDTYSKQYDIAVDDLARFLKYAGYDSKKNKLEKSKEVKASAKVKFVELDIIDASDASDASDSSDSSESSDASEDESDHSDESYEPEESSEDSEDSDDEYDVQDEILDYLQRIDRKLNCLLKRRNN